MTTKDSVPTTGLDGMKSFIAWWGVPNAPATGKLETQMKRFQSFATDLQRDCGDAYSQQMQALITANQQLAQSLQELMRCRQPQDIIAAESNILATLFEGASGQAKGWMELTQKVQQSCVAMARDAAEEAGAQVQQTLTPRASAETERRSARQMHKEPAHT